MKLKHIIICTVGLLVAGIGYASADPGAGKPEKSQGVFRGPVTC